MAPGVSSMVITDYLPVSDRGLSDSKLSGSTGPRQLYSDSVVSTASVSICLSGLFPALCVFGIDINLAYALSHIHRG